MTAIRNRIMAYAQNYFPEPKVNEFVDLVEPWDRKAKMAFLQVTQQEDKPVLEYGCVTGKVLFDVTFSLDSTRYGVLSVASIGAVLVQRNEASVTLTINPNEPRGFAYRATTDQFRADLLSYANYVLELLAGAV